MVRNCCIKDCGSVWHPNTNISFHSFPTDSEILMKWVNNITPKSKITKNSVVCSKHFLRSDFDYSCTKPRLKITAVPDSCEITTVTDVQNDVTIEVDKSDAQNLKKEKITAGIPNVNKNSDLFMKETAKQPCCNKNLSVNIMEPIINSTKRKLSSNEKEEYLKWKVHILQERLRRREERIKNIQILVKNLKRRSICIYKPEK